jgi:hypothetical protein
LAWGVSFGCGSEKEIGRLSGSWKIAESFPEGKTFLLGIGRLSGTRRKAVGNQKAFRFLT